MSGLRNRRRAPLWLWLPIALALAGSCAALAGFGTVHAFRNILLPGQQQRIIDQLPFLRILRQPTPEGGTLPTAIPVENAIAAAELLADDGFFAPATEAPPSSTAASSPTATVTATTIPVSATTHPRPTATTLLSPTMSAPLSPALPSSENTNVRPSSARLSGLSHITQTWNNCGPANLGMALSYFGWQGSQEFIAEALKPDREDKNVSPHELVAFANEHSDVKALSRAGGNLELLKDLVAAGFPVIVETGFMPEGYDWIGHYQTVVAYDDNLGQFRLFDSYLGIGADQAGLVERYAQLDGYWRHFNRVFIVLYEPTREAELRALLAVLAEPQAAVSIALEQAREEARADRHDVFAWFNIGASLTRLGRHEEAAAAFDQARRSGTLPWRLTWYRFEPFAAYFESGRLDDVLALVNVNLANGARYVEETWYWQGRVHAARGDLQGARQAWRQALQHNPNYDAARSALAAL